MTELRRTTDQPILMGNWKMNLNLKAIESYMADFVRALDVRQWLNPVVLFPSFPYLLALRTIKLQSANSMWAYGGQDCFFEEEGAFTGAVAAAMLKDVGCTLCLIGHSERRQFFGDSNEIVGRKFASVSAAQMTPVLCVGETLAERSQGQTWAVIEAQLRSGLKSCMAAADAANSKFVIAYEPVWAIGTGRVALAAEAQEVHAQIRAWLASHFGAGPAQASILLYGGSVKPENSSQLFAEPDIDGFLVGGASLNPQTLLAIV